MKVLIALLLFQDIVIDGWLKYQQNNNDVDDWSFGALERIVRQAHAVIVILEMLLFSIMFHSSFSASSFKTPKEDYKTVESNGRLTSTWLFEVMRCNVFESSLNGSETSRQEKQKVLEVVTPNETNGLGGLPKIL